MAYKKGAYTPPSKVKHFVAVYGSLRPGMENEGVNKSAGAAYIGKGKTNDNCNLYQYSSGYFPSVSLEHDGNGKPVVVDIFEVAQEGLEGAYDSLEGYPGFYDRTKVLVRMYNDDLIEAWIYHIDEEQETLVESGDWIEFKTKPETIAKEEEDLGNYYKFND